MVDDSPGDSAPSMLIINPNSTESMTRALEPLVASLRPSIWQYTFHTGPPNSPPSINNNDDAKLSSDACTPLLTPDILNAHDAFLVACYSAHPLVAWLRTQPEVRDSHKPVTGIFEASISVTLGLYSQAVKYPDWKFGIVSTGSVWEGLLEDAVRNYLGVDNAGSRNLRFVGVRTTGLSASELHTTDADDVRKRLKAATRSLVRKPAIVKAVCLGCAGMAGMDAIVREACIEELGEQEGWDVEIIDGVVAGVIFLEGTWRAQRASLLLASRQHH